MGAYCHRAQQAGLTWPLPAEWDDAQLEARLLQRVGALIGVPRPLPDMAWLHQELKRPAITDPTTSELIAVELFVGALGASSCMYAETCASRELPARIAAHVRQELDGATASTRSPSPVTRTSTA